MPACPDADGGVVARRRGRVRSSRWRAGLRPWRRATGSRRLRRDRVGDVDHEQRPRPHRRRLDVFEAFGELDERVGTAVCPRVPRLTFGGTHAVDHPVDGVLEPRPVEIRQLTADREHPPIRLPPHPQTPAPHAGRGLRPSWGALRAHHPRQIHRRDMRRPPRPLRVARLVRQLRDRPQLLATQRARIRRRRDLAAATPTPARSRPSRAPCAPTPHPPPPPTRPTRPAHRAPGSPRAPPPATAAAHAPARTAAPPTTRSPGGAADRDTRSRRTWTHPTTGV